jgi:hypothetical protein
MATSMARYQIALRVGTCGPVKSWGCRWIFKSDGVNTSNEC